MAMFARRIEGETPELHAEGVRMRFIGRRTDPVPPELIERMEWAEELTARQHADHAVRRVQLRRQGGDRRCGANLYRWGRRGVPRPPVRARHARPRPDHPHQRRAADLELPAVAVGVLGARVPRRAVAGLLARGVRAEPDGVRGAQAPLRRAGDAMRARPQAPTRSDVAAGASAPQPRREPRSRAERSDLLGAVLVAVPAAIVAIVFVDLGGLAFALFMIAARRASACTSCTGCSRAGGRCRSSASRRSSGWCWRRATAACGPVLEVAVATSGAVPVVLAARAPRQRDRRDRRHAARRLLDRLRVRARRAAAPAAATATGS